MNKLTIGEVAKHARVRIETMRYYERRGLVAPPPRNGANYRLYPPDTVRRVQFIKHAQQLGFSLKEISELLALRATPETPCADIRARTVAKIDAIEAKLRALHAMKHALTQLVAACSGQGAVTDCPILASLDTEGAYDRSCNAQLADAFSGHAGGGVARGGNLPSAAHGGAARNRLPVSPPGERSPGL